MAETDQSAPEHWSSRTGFILATVGSAVGIGSIWKFPYEVGANGGSAFVLLYVLGLVFIVIPLMLAEFAIGRRGGGDTVTSIANVAAHHGAMRHWAWAGWVGVITGFLILSFYSVIGGWTIAYATDTLLHGLQGGDVLASQARYENFLASPWRLAMFHAAFMAAAALIVARGIARGIEKAVTVMMPLLGVLMVALAAYSVVEGNLAATIEFLFKLDTQKLNFHTALEALGLGFFSIGVGMGLMIVYAAYSRREISLTSVALISVSADTAISLLAGFIVFPIVFANGLDPASGPGLVFVTLPIAFAKMPFGAVAAAAFFTLLFVAALASAISMLEVVVAMLSQRLGWSRPKTTGVAAAVCFLAGIATVLSFNVLAHWHPLAGLATFANATLFDLIDHATSNLLLPLGGLAISMFAGWAIPEEVLRDELKLSRRLLPLLRWALRFVVPAAILVATLSPWIASL
ncbi:MAG: sodium-dependent transporter [Burkholderiales bacterium]